MKVYKNNRGAVSVFLIIILVPCLLVSSIFVDLGRVHMAKAMGESAADLALNSLLTNYDADLKDWYGMIASCQNIDEFYEVSAEFFLRTISSQGMSDDEIYLLSDYYAQATNDDTIYDLLKIEPKTETNKIVSAVENANLSNPTLIKDSIIEFMKYRAPIELTVNLIDRLKDTNGAGAGRDSLLDADEDKPLVDAKQSYYKAEGELLTNAFYSYLAIKKYYNNAAFMSLNNQKLGGYINDFNNYKHAYEQIHEITVKNLLNTSGLTQYTRIIMELDKYKYDKTCEEVHTGIEEKEVNTDSDSDSDTDTDTDSDTDSDTDNDSDSDTEKVTIYYIEGTDVTSLLDSLEQKITEYEGAQTELVNAGKNLMTNPPGEGDTSPYAVQWWVQMEAAINSASSTNYTSSLAIKADDMLKAYALVKAIDDCDEIRNAPSDWQTRSSNLTAKVETYQNNYLNNPAGISDEYTQMVSKLESMYPNYASRLKPENHYVSVGSNQMSIIDALSSISIGLTTIRKDLSDRRSELYIAIYGGTLGENTVVSLDTLSSLAGTYDTSLNTWDNIATGSTTSMGGTDKKYIDEELVLEDKINSTSVSELKTRLVNIYNQLGEIIDVIDTMTYGSLALKDIDSFAEMKTETLKVVNIANIPLTNADLKKYAMTDTFSQLFSPNNTPVATLANTNNNNYNPDINPSESNTVDTPELYVYFHKTWQDVDTTEFNNTKKEEETVKNEQAKYEEAQKNAASAYRGGGANPVKDFSQGNEYNATSLVTSIVGLFQNIIDGNYDYIRDDLYVTTYIMDMFSYATFDREGQYSLIEDPTTLSLKDDAYKNSYKTVYGDEQAANSEDNDGKWLSKNVTDSYNKTLTNVLINKENNASYLAEVEYILYGKSTNEENLKAAFGTIYGLRYALNLISCFDNFWKDSTIDFVSGLISKALGSVVPKAVIKVVLLPILTAIETCRDNTRLSAGFPVEIYKVDQDDWWIWPKANSDSDTQNDVSLGSGYSSFFTNLTNGNLFTYENTGEGLFYSDYIMLFVYTGLASNGEVEKDIYQRVAELIQTNMNKKLGTTGDDNKYSMKKAVMYFKLESQIRVKPLMITLPIFSEYDNGMKTTTDWCTFDITTVRGYS